MVRNDQKLDHMTYFRRYLDFRKKSLFFVEKNQIHYILLVYLCEIRVNFTFRTYYEIIYGYFGHIFFSKCVILLKGFDLSKFYP